MDLTRRSGLDDGPHDDLVACSPNRCPSLDSDLGLSNRDLADLKGTCCVHRAACRPLTCGSGSEAVHAALRLARGYTGRQKILKFEGHYHGWLDPVLYSVHPDTADYRTARQFPVVPGTRGQQLSTADDLIVVPWNDLPAVEAVLEEHGNEIAAIITEPVLCNSGAILPEEGFLEGLLRLAHSAGALLIFDEIITGFRLAPGGASEYFGVHPDLMTFGKAIAGGMPLSVLAGRRDVMDLIARGEVAHAGTFNSHPVAVAAALATLEQLRRQPEHTYSELTRLGRDLMRGLQDAAQDCGEPLLVDGPGPVFQTYFTEHSSVSDYRSFEATDRARNRDLQRLLVERGVNVNARGLWFLSTAHTEQDIQQTVDSFRDALKASRQPATY